APTDAEERDYTDEIQLVVALLLCWLAKFLEEQAEVYAPVSARAFRASARVVRLLADSDNAMTVPGKAETELRVSAPPEPSTEAP
ncbi:MAG TPA: hypothetical protein VGP44_12780, partial [Gemmatimonadales bacterium]|nr:hypothetical protein [Gemmatimonadales bacterium]